MAIHFHSVVGITPKAFIANCRLHVAQALLAKTEIPIWQISESLGYSSIQVFSRAFYRLSGVRPNAFRRSELKPTENEAAPAKKSTSG